MHLVVDGVVYGQQRFGGINTIFNEILPRLAARDNVRVSFLLPPNPVGALPAWPVRRRNWDPLPTRTGWSWKLDQALEPALKWMNAALIRALVMASNSVFQSTYFTEPPASTTSVAIALDMNHELFASDFEQTPFGRWLRQQYRKYLYQSNRIVAISNTTKEHVIRFYGIDPSLIDVVYPATNPEAFFHDPDPSVMALLETLGVHGPYVLYVGGRWTYKNFGGLLETFAAPGALDGVTLVVAGCPLTESEMRLIESLRVSRRVVHVEYPDGALLRRLYSFASTFVYPSLHEGFGVPLLEAMACGTPIAASDTAIFREVAGEAAVYFDPRDPADIGRAIEVSMSGETRARLVTLGFHRVKQFSWAASTDGMYEVYRRALAEHHRRRPPRTG